MLIRRTGRPPRASLAVASVGVAALLAGCAPGSDPDDDAADADPEEDENSEASDEQAADPEEETVLRVVDARTGDEAIQATFERIDRAFEEEHPGVVVERESIDLEEMQTTINLRLSDDAPDVTAVNMGHGILGPLVAADLLQPLDEYADEYGWWERQPDSLLAMNGRHTEDGSRMGEGPLYAVSDTGAPIGVYYDPTMLDDLGLELPETWDEFEAAMDVARDEGITPVMFGNVDGWPGIHLFQLFLNDSLGRDGVADFVFGNSPLEEDGAEAAAEDAQRWVAEGAFPDGWEGIDYDSLGPRFAEGEALFFPSGSWVAGDLADLNPDLRFFLMPRSDAGDQPVATASGDFPWSIPANAENPDIAAEYIDFRIGADAAAMYIEDGIIPATLPEDWEDHADNDSLQYDLLAAWDELGAADGMAPYLDWSTPDSEVWTSGFGRGVVSR